jgi:N-acyl-L-homoserine lactone synthetase
MHIHHSDAACEMERHFSVELARTPDVMREAQQLRHQVFRLERGILPQSQGETLECDEYDLRSRHVVLRHRDNGEVVGTARLVAPVAEASRHCLPMLRYCGADLLKELPAATTGEISRFALSKRRRDLGAAWDPLLRLGLMQGILRASLEMGLTHWCALMEPTLLRLLRAGGVRFVALGPLVEAYGQRQPSAAAIDFALADGKRRRPDLYRFITGAPAARPGPAQRMAMG